MKLDYVNCDTLNLKTFIEQNTLETIENVSLVMSTGINHMFNKLYRALTTNVFDDLFYVLQRDPVQFRWLMSSSLGKLTTYTAGAIDEHISSEDCWLYDQFITWRANCIHDVKFLKVFLTRPVKYVGEMDSVLPNIMGHLQLAGNIWDIYYRPKCESKLLIPPNQWFIDTYSGRLLYSSNQRIIPDGVVCYHRFAKASRNSDITHLFINYDGFVRSYVIQAEISDTRIGIPLMPGEMPHLDAIVAAIDKLEA